MENFKQHGRGRERGCFWKWSTVSQWREVGSALIFDLSYPLFPLTTFLSLFLKRPVLLQCLSLLKRFMASATASISAPCSHRDQSQVCQCYDSPTLTDTCIKNRCTKVDISLHFVKHYRFNNTITFFFNRWYISCCSNSAYFFIMSSFSQASLLKASTSPAATLLHRFCTDIKFSTPTTTTHRHVFLHSCNPMFHITPAAAAAQYEH